MTRILVVEDDPAILRGLSDNLRLESYEVVTAGDGEEFERKATELAKDLPRVAELRRTLRDRMAASPLMDEKGYSQALARAYREMWREWCRVGK